MPAYYSFSEAPTRYGLTDPQRTKRGWNSCDRCSVSLEVPVDGYNAIPVNRITDFLKYVLKPKEVTHFVKGVQNGFAFMLEHNYNVARTFFLGTVQTIVT